MIEADRVHSTPHTNVPIDTTRRRFLAVAAMPGTSPAIPAIPACASDPIYAAIEKHRAAGIVWEAAVDAWAKFCGGPRDPINDALCDARDAMDDVGVSLINTRPTTLHGIAAALNYIREQMVQEDGIYMPSDLTLKGSDYPEIVGWIDAFLDTIEDAATDLAGKAVQS